MIIITVLLTVVILFFPLKINYGVLYENLYKTLYFKVDILGINFKYGKLYLEDNKIKILINKKIKTIKLKDLLSFNKSIKLYIDLNVMSINGLVNYSFNSLTTDCFLMFLTGFFTRFLIAYFYNKKPYLKIDIKAKQNEVLVNENNTSLYFFGFLFINIFSILLILLSGIIGRIKLGTNKK